MTVLVTGGTGYVGRFIVEELIGAGYGVAVIGRQTPQPGFFSAPVAFRSMALDPATIDRRHFAGVDQVVHAAFHHLPGRYRGGEGDDPETFRRINLNGSIALFRAAKEAGVRRLAFISSRAVYGTQPPGMALTEETPAAPDTLYGEVKFEAERALGELASSSFTTASLRLTGVYGPAGAGLPHKWTGLFAGRLAGRPIEPRCGTEVHGGDAARAVRLALESDALAGAAVLNVSDILVDRRDILALFDEVAGVTRPLPLASPGTAAFNTMATERLRALGWQPGGWPLFERTVRQLAREFLNEARG